MLSSQNTCVKQLQRIGQEQVIPISKFTVNCICAEYFPKHNVIRTYIDRKDLFTFLFQGYHWPSVDTTGLGSWGPGDYFINDFFSSFKLNLKLHLFVIKLLSLRSQLISHRPRLQLPRRHPAGNCGYKKILIHTCPKCAPWHGVLVDPKASSGDAMTISRRCVDVLGDPAVFWNFLGRRAVGLRTPSWCGRGFRRRGAALFFKVICQIFQGDRAKKNRRFWPKLGISEL